MMSVRMEERMEQDRQYRVQWLRKLYDLPKSRSLAHELRNTLVRFGLRVDIGIVSALLGVWRLVSLKSRSSAVKSSSLPRPPFNAEYLLYLFLRKDERDVVIGDLIEDYGRVLERFNKRRADIWFYKQVAGSLVPLIRRALLRIGALVWLGRVLRRLIS
jgi:hypothetical protein